MTTIRIATIAKAATLAAVAGTLLLGLAGPAQAASGTMYGDPSAAAKYWRHQQYDDWAYRHGCWPLISEAACSLDVVDMVGESGVGLEEQG